MRMPLVGDRLIGKYRRLLIPFDQLAAEAAALAPLLEELRFQGAASSIHEADLVTGFIRLFAEARSERKWPHIPGLPETIYGLLGDWREGRAYLMITTKPATACEMLEAQAQGRRYVTIAWDEALAGETVEETRDAFEFALHDLGHAYAFFKADYHPQGQQAFFGELLADTVALQPLAESDAKFAAALEYCMADMNSHPQHLRQYLRGVIVEAYLRRPGHDEAELQALLENLQCLRDLRPVVRSR